MQKHLLPVVEADCASCGTRLSGVFAALTVLETEEVTSVKTCTRFDKGDAIIRQDEHPRGIYCIHSGHIKVTRNGPDGREQIIRFAGPGDSLGYAALVSDSPYSYSATAVDTASLCFVPREIIFRLVRENTHLTLRLLQILSHELEDTERRVVEIARKSVRERVAEALLILRETFGYEADGKTLNMTLTREEIADIVGTAPESVIRMLTDLKNEELIETEGRRIRVKNLRGLVAAANLVD